MKFTTESGSAYRIEGTTITRYASESASKLRKDGKGVPLLEMIVLELGKPASFIIKGLDDYDGYVHTHRITTPVVSIDKD